jgi:hypothetical protein
MLFQKSFPVLFIENELAKPIDYFSFVMGLLAIIIAFATVIIALRQYQNDRYKIKIDLFDRRLEVYLLLGKIIAQLIHGLPSDDPNGWHLIGEISRCERMSKFLFPMNLQNEISDILSKGIKLLTIRDELIISSKDIERDARKKEKSRIILFLSDKLNNLENMFDSEMNLRQ